MVVDPCDAEAVEHALEHLSDKFYAKRGGLRLEAVLCTHRHWDHAGGNEPLAARAKAESVSVDNSDSEAGSDSDVARTHRPLSFAYPLKVFGGLEDDVPGCTHPLQHGDQLQFGKLYLEAVAAPGHTVGSLMYRLVCRDDTKQCPGIDALFTGDTLFSGGCGAQFEGSKLDIEHCFATILESSMLSKETLLFPGHEYTAMLMEQNLHESLDSPTVTKSPGRFMKFVSAFYVASHRRALRDKLPTVPISLSGERMINPHFNHGLRRHVDTLLSAINADEPGVIERVDTTQDLERQNLGSHPATARSRKEDVSCPVISEGNMPDYYQLDAGIPPAKSLVVLYRADFEAFRQELLSGKLTGAAAAQRLSNLEQRALDAPLLTGGADSFRDGGLDSDDEDAIAAEVAECAVQGRDEDATAGASGEAAADEGTDDAEQQAEETSADKALPTKANVVEALKVLAVPAYLPVGHKSPYRDGDLPLSLERLEAILGQLEVPIASIRALLSSLQRAGASSSDSSSSDESRRRAASTTCLARCCTCRSSRRWIFAAQADSADSGQLLPLRCALESLLPSSSSESWSFSRIFRCLPGFCCCQRRGDGAAGTSNEAPPNPEDENDAQEPPSPPPEAVVRRRRLAAVEKRFASHKPDGCPLCISSFRPCSSNIDLGSTSHRAL
eukprot:TRINITY_DN34398_c0_g1_i1.p1 TRINITY_DN34398_c0_g1~~TRINITY_DN34398_c0_g1_i1.p1  ORF type:complete len:757 (+),score=130.54 TRINITY_DN34398_c0_g1_i1:262-2271(+)